ncbi:winged helix DNA-binding domain-containing protein [Flavobacterium silvaticum]|uniref:Winged helix DNA-binding domain-containing protein n=1 Tax=Flavobacterium silvaticum TaxID=1852020 RepID=A0A972JIN0_9FLAO|nr:winged helix DNA-binding domain-containing protein [Flavobacterium silvaticum]NMH29220.1 winged helix DNA-binding domain-containing protein [Flavobacterium silvaticum]
MKFTEIASQRLINQQLINPEIKSIKTLVSHLGAIQAQDFSMSKWAIGVRIPGISEDDVEKALDDADIVRTHVLRPTWHLTSADDIPWMLELTGKNIRRLMGTNDRKLGLDDAIFKKALKLIEKALSDGEHLTRLELMEILNYHNINTSEYRSGHFMMAAELDGLVISGKKKGKEQTYALLAERVKNPVKFSREEALAELAKRYFTSHGPATLLDFMWWSGLSKTDCKTAVSSNEKMLEKAEIQQNTYYFAKWHDVKAGKSSQLLPAFDEFFVGYKDRSASLNPDHHKHTFTANGIFRPILVLDGQGCGIWKRVNGKATVTVETTFLDQIPESRKASFEKQVKAYSNFIGQKISYKSSE